LVLIYNPFKNTHIEDALNESIFEDFENLEDDYQIELLFGLVIGTLVAWLHVDLVLSFSKVFGVR